MEIPVEATGEADPLTGDPEVDVAAVIGEAVAAGVTAGAVGGAVVAVGVGSSSELPPHAARIAANSAMIAIAGALENHRLTVINAMLLSLNSEHVIAAVRKA